MKLFNTKTEEVGASARRARREHNLIPEGNQIGRSVRHLEGSEVAKQPTRMKVRVLSLIGKAEEYEVDAETPVVSVGIDEGESFVYNGKRLVLCCKKCQKHLTFGDLEIEIENEKEDIKLYRMRNIGGPRVEKYVFPFLYGVPLISTHDMCGACQDSNAIACARKIMDIVIETKSNIDVGTMYGATEVIGANIKNYLPLVPYTNMELDISKCKPGDIVIIKISTTVPCLVGGARFAASSTPFLEYRIKIVEPYWTTKTSIIFLCDKQIRKELISLQSVFRFPKDIILYIGRFL